MSDRGFKPSDLRRVQAALDQAIPYPYEAETAMSADGQLISTRITCPDTTLPVGGATFVYEHQVKPHLRQPPDKEVERIGQELAKICNDWPSVLAGQMEQFAKTKAERQALSDAQLAADIQAMEEQLEREIESETTNRVAGLDAAS
jgi:hypothetical protein